MNNRTKKLITTPAGHKAVVYDYITGGEMQEIARKAQGKDAGIDATLEAGNYALSVVVRELDGSTEEILPRLLDLPFPDFNAIQTEVQALIDPEKK